MFSINSKLPAGFKHRLWVQTDQLALQNPFIPTSSEVLEVRLTDPLSMSRNPKRYSEHHKPKMPYALGNLKTLDPHTKKALNTG